MKSVNLLISLIFLNYKRVINFFLFLDKINYDKKELLRMITEI
jgi:hypothetical protein